MSLRSLAAPRKASVSGSAVRDSRSGYRVRVTGYMVSDRHVSPAITGLGDLCHNFHMLFRWWTWRTDVVIGIGAHRVLSDAKVCGPAIRFHTSILSHGDLSCKRFGYAANFTLGLVCRSGARSIIDGL